MKVKNFLLTILTILAAMNVQNALAQSAPTASNSAHDQIDQKIVAFEDDISKASDTFRKEVKKQAKEVPDISNLSDEQIYQIVSSSLSVSGLDKYFEYDDYSHIPNKGAYIEKKFIDNDFTNGITIDLKKNELCDILITTTAQAQTSVTLSDSSVIDKIRSSSLSSQTVNDYADATPKITSSMKLSEDFTFRAISVGNTNIIITVSGEISDPKDSTKTIKKSKSVLLTINVAE
jgi:hypothetical protein